MSFEVVEWNDTVTKQAAVKNYPFTNNAGKRSVG